MSRVPAETHPQICLPRSFEWGRASSQQGVMNSAMLFCSTMAASRFFTESYNREAREVVHKYPKALPLRLVAGMLPPNPPTKRALRVELVFVKVGTTLRRVSPWGRRHTSSTSQIVYAELFRRVSSEIPAGMANYSVCLPYTAL